MQSNFKVRNKSSKPPETKLGQEHEKNKQLLREAVYLWKLASVCTYGKAMIKCIQVNVS
jgi:hypothetical protein